MLGIMEPRTKRLTCLLEELGVATDLEAMRATLKSVGPMLHKEFLRSSRALDEVCAEHPRIAASVEDLDREQEEILAAIDHMIALCERGAIAARALTRRRSALLWRIRDQLKNENELLLEVYLRDLGGQG